MTDNSTLRQLISLTKKYEQDAIQQADVIRRAKISEHLIIKDANRKFRVAYNSFTTTYSALLKRPEFETSTYGLSMPAEKMVRLVEEVNEKIRLVNESLKEFQVSNTGEKEIDISQIIVTPIEVPQHGENLNPQDHESSGDELARLEGTFKRQQQIIDELEAEKSRPAFPPQKPLSPITEEQRENSSCSQGQNSASENNEQSNQQLFEMFCSILREGMRNEAQPLLSTGTSAQVFHVTEKSKLRPPIFPKNSLKIAEWFADWKVFTELPENTSPAYQLSVLKNVCLKDSPKVLELLNGIDTSLPENLPIIINRLKDEFIQPLNFIDRNLDNWINLPIPPKNLNHGQKLRFIATSLENLRRNFTWQLQMCDEELKTSAEINNALVNCLEFRALRERLGINDMQMVVDEIKIYDKPIDTSIVLEALKARAALVDRIDRKGNSIVESADNRTAIKFAGDVETSSENICLFCKEDSHITSACKNFIKMNHRERWQHLKENGVCCCLNAKYKDCSCKVNDEDNCVKCHKNHHFLLHNDRNQ